MVKVEYVGMGKLKFGNLIKFYTLGLRDVVLDAVLVQLPLQTQKIDLTFVASNADKFISSSSSIISLSSSNQNRNDTDVAADLFLTI